MPSVVPPPSVMSLKQSPADIILSITSHLPVIDVSHVSQTCKRLRNLTLPQLYRVITWHWDGEANPEVLPSPLVPLLLRSLIRQPELGLHIKSLDFDGVEHVQARKSSAARRPPIELGFLKQPDLRLLIRRLQGLGFAPIDGLGEDLCQGCIGAYICCVLALSPNIRTLRLEPQYIGGRTGLLDGLMKLNLRTDEQGSAILPIFTSLLRLEIGHVAVTDRRWRVKAHLRQLYAFLNSPSVEYLAIELSSANDFIWPTQPVIMRKLTSLLLPRCEANEITLERLLSSRPPLQELLYEYHCAEDTDYRKGYYFNLNTMSRALSHVEITLRKLTISFEHLSPDADDYPCYSRGLFVGSLMSLEILTRLTHLEIGFVMLLGWTTLGSKRLVDMLPAALCHLCLTDNLADWVSCDWESEHVLTQLRDLLYARQESGLERLSSLESIEVKRRSDIFEWGEEDSTDLRRLGENYGLRLFFS